MGSLGFAFQLWPEQRKFCVSLQQKLVNLRICICEPKLRDHNNVGQMCEFPHFNSCKNRRKTPLLYRTEMSGILHCDSQLRIARVSTNRALECKYYNVLKMSGPVPCFRASSHPYLLKIWLRQLLMCWGRELKLARALTVTLQTIFSGSHLIFIILGSASCHLAGNKEGCWERRTVGWWLFCKLKSLFIRFLVFVDFHRKKYVLMLTVWVNNLYWGYKLFTKSRYRCNH